MAAELIIFDCDGVLVDSEPIAARVLAEALREVGIFNTAQEVDSKYRGRSLPDIEEHIEADLGRPLPQGFTHRLSEMTRVAFDAQLKPVEGVRDLLMALSQKGLDLCVASSGSPEKIRHSLELTALRQFFEDRLFSAQEVERGKPAPDLFLHAAKSMGHPIERSVVIEDSVPGVTGAVTAGAHVFSYVAPTLVDFIKQKRALSDLGSHPFHQMNQVLELLERMEK